MAHEGKSSTDAAREALGLVCERWSLFIVRELLTGPQRYTDLRRAIPGISSNVLAMRLRQLMVAGIIEHYTLPPPAASQVYALSAWGMGLRPVVEGLEVWGRHGVLEDPAPR